MIAPDDYPGGKKGDAPMVEFTVVGIPCLGLNGGPAFRHSEAFSFQIARLTRTPVWILAQCRKFATPWCS
jgi:predicted 3-demethylubiquinone-9 3-methyltransferase (glyoxalase superfamily)